MVISYIKLTEQLIDKPWKSTKETRAINKLKQWLSNDVKRRGIK